MAGGLHGQQRHAHAHSVQVLKAQRCIRQVRQGSLRKAGSSAADIIDAACPEHVSITQSRQGLRDVAAYRKVAAAKQSMSVNRPRKA